MANGDLAAAAGYEVVPGGKDLKLGYDDINLTRDYIAALKAQIAAQAEPAGTSKEGHWVVEPPGYFFEDGRLLNRAQYPALFAAIGTRYNTGGETATTFRIPDSRGRVAVAKAASGTFVTLGGKTGAETHTLTIAQMPQHSHNVDQPVVALDGENGAGITVGGASYAVKNAAPTGLQGGNLPHNNLQPSIVLNRAIKY